MCFLHNFWLTTIALVLDIHPTPTRMWIPTRQMDSGVLTAIDSRKQPKEPSNCVCLIKLWKKTKHRILREPPPAFSTLCGHSFKVSSLRLRFFCGDLNMTLIFRSQIPLPTKPLSPSDILINCDGGKPELFQFDPWRGVHDNATCYYRNHSYG